MFFLKSRVMVNKQTSFFTGRYVTRLGFAPRSKSFAFVASPHYAQFPRYPDSLSLHPSVNPPNTYTTFLIRNHKTIEEIRKLISSMVGES